MLHYTLGIGPNQALLLENELLNWHPRWEADINYFIGDSAVQRFLSTDMFHAKKQSIDLISAEVCMPYHNL